MRSKDPRTFNPNYLINFRELLDWTELRNLRIKVIRDKYVDFSKYYASFAFRRTFKWRFRINREWTYNDLGNLATAPKFPIIYMGPAIVTGKQA